MKKYNVVIAGCGNMAPDWVPYTLTRSDTEIVGLADVSQENAQRLKDRFHLSCPIFGDVVSAIESTGANLVFNVTPPEVHKQIVISSVQHGCDVFGEKPIADTLENAQEMIAAAKKYGKTYAVMQNRRFLKGTRGFKSIAESGLLGKIGFVSTEFYINPGYGSFRDRVLEHALLTDMAVHHFDMLRFMFGVEPVSAYCHEFSPPGSWFVGKPAALCLFEMTDGLVYSYTGYWSGRTLKTTWEGNWRAEGSLGSARWNESNEQVCEVVKYTDIRDGEQTERVVPENTWQGLTWHSGCIESMFESLSCGEKPMTDCTDNIRSMAMVYAAIRSAEEKRKVEVVY